MKSSIIKNLSMFILFTINAIVLCLIFITLAILVKEPFYIGIIGAVIITIIYICLLIWAPEISPFYIIKFDNQGFGIYYFKNLKKRVNWTDLSSITYEYHSKLGFYIFSFKTKKQKINIVYEKKLQKLILQYCNDPELLKLIK